MKQKIAVLTSGGDAPGMNAAVRAVTRTGLFHGCEVLGVMRGYDGVINGDFLPMQLGSVAGIINRGGTMLKSARSEMFRTEEGFAKAVQNLKNNDIDVVVVVGGDGSMAGARKLTAAGISTIVIPATIDGDMAGTEYTLGFDTALNTIVDAVNKIRDTAFSHDRIAVIEVMGRHSGQLALMAGLACGAEVILLPEMQMNMDELCEGLVRSCKRGKAYSIVMVAEGVGRGRDIAELIAQRTEFSPHVTVLGYLQRGGAPSAVDNIMGSRMGAAAVENIMQGKLNCLIAQRHGEIATVPYALVQDYQPQVDYSLYELASILATGEK